MTVSAEPLKGCVSLDELKPGNTFHESVLPQQDTVQDWIQIPNWMAGVWESNKMIISGPRGVTAVRAYSQGAWGHQVDSRGDVWHLVTTPSVTKTTFSDHIDYGIIQSKQYRCFADRVEGVATIRHFTIDRNGQVLRVATVQHQKTCVPYRDGEVHSTDRTETGVKQTIDRRSQRFYPREQVRGIDCRQSLNSYLRAHGMANRCTD